MLQACSQRVDFKFRRNFGERHRFWCRLQGSASFISLLSWTEVGLKSMFSCLNESIAASAENSWFNSHFQCKRSRQEIALSLARTAFWRGTQLSVESIVMLRDGFSVNAKQ